LRDVLFTHCFWFHVKLQKACPAGQAFFLLLA
jgi:hypothetical protein